MTLLFLIQLCYSFELSLALNQLLKNSKDSKIVGGQEVSDISDYPGVISIQANAVGHICAGSLLTSNYVVTSCQCLADITSSLPRLKIVTDYVFIGGTRDIWNIGNGQKRVAKRFVIHPGCRIINGFFPVMDYGIAEMQEQFYINQYVRPVRIYSMDSKTFAWKFHEIMSEHDTSCFIAGWGESRVGVNSQFQMTRFLKILRMYQVGYDSCEDSFYRKYGVHHIDFEKNDQICAVGRNPNDSDCEGDKGGPFMCDNYVVAIISFGVGCNAQTPRILATFAPLLEWFTKSVQTHGKVAQPRRNRCHRKKPFFLLLVFTVCLINFTWSHLGVILLKRPSTTEFVNT